MYVHSFFFCIDLGELSSRDKTTEGVQFFLRFSGFKKNGNKLINNSCLSQSNEKSNRNPQMHTCKQIIQFHMAHKLHNILLAV